MKDSGFIDDKILQEAITKWGIDAQIEMIKEECVELTLALMKFPRAQSDEEADKRSDDIIDELADVTIMLAQAKKIFNLESINKRIDFKMDRLKNRLEKY